MTVKKTKAGGMTPSDVEFGAHQNAAVSVLQIPRDEILQYIQEMCATLSHMSIAHKCDRLSGLLAAAAAEAESNIGADGGCASAARHDQRQATVRRETR